MKHGLLTSTFVIAALSVLAGCGSQPTAKPVTADDVSDMSTTPATPKAEDAPVAATTNDDGVQVATVTVDGKFNPATIKVKAGKPVKLTFDTKDKACADTVLFKSLGKTIHLADGTTTVVDFTPEKAGTVDYACSMDMMRGKIVVE